MDFILQVESAPIQYSTWYPITHYTLLVFYECLTPSLSNGSEIIHYHTCCHDEEDNYLGDKAPVTVATVMSPAFMIGPYMRLEVPLLEVRPRAAFLWTREELSRFLVCLLMLLHPGFVGETLATFTAQML